MRETLQLVMATEDAAARLVDAAREEGEALLADARRQARERLEACRKEARLEAEGILKAAAEAAGREKAERIRRAAGEIEATVRLEEPAALAAVKAIVQCVCARGPS